MWCWRHVASGHAWRAVCAVFACVVTRNAQLDAVPACGCSQGQPDVEKSQLALNMHKMPRDAANGSSVGVGDASSREDIESVGCAPLIVDQQARTRPSPASTLRASTTRHAAQRAGVRGGLDAPHALSRCD